MIIRLWKGYHSADLAPLIGRSFDENVLLILCPPQLQDFSFLVALPAGELEFFGAWTPGERSALEAVVRDAGDLREVPILGVFTSGTLSHTPRLALYSKRGVTASIQGIFSLFDLSRIEHVFCYPQAFHTFGLTLGYLASHVQGWKLHTPEGKYSSASHTQRLALRESHVLTLGTPTHFFDLLKASGQMAPSYTCIMGGASVTRDLWLKVQRELNIERPSIGYGCTEAAPGITHLPPGQVPAYDDEIGMPLSSLTSQVLPGGVEISGDSLCMATVQNGQIDFPSSLIIRDRIVLSESGSWRFQGRVELLLNRGGAKFSLEAIERTLFNRLGITSVACSVRDDRLGEDLGLAIVGPEQVFESAREVLQNEFSLKLRLDHSRFVTDLPLNESSKIDRKIVGSMFEADQ